MGGHAWRTGCVCCAVVGLSLACSSQPQIAEKNPQPTVTQPAMSAPVQAPARQLAKDVPHGEVKRALTRIYGARLSASARNSRALGDFNGDGIEDLALIATPTRGSLTELNDPLANWIVQQARNENPAMAPEIQAADRLLVIIHGDGRSGWRNPEALQSYLIREAAGRRLRSLPFNPSKVPAEARPLMFAGKDVIRQRLDGEMGFIYWDGARYRWLSDVSPAETSTSSAGH